MTAPTTAEGWRDLFDTLPYYGDGMVSVRLDGRRLAFLTGDAVPRSGLGRWAHSTLTVVTDGTAWLYVDDPLGDPPFQVIPDDATGLGYHWFGPAFAAGGTLWSLAPHVTPSTGGFRFESLGVDWARLDVGHRLRFRDLAATGHTVYGRVRWGSGVWYDRLANWVYVFGTSPEPVDGWTGHDVYVARSRPWVVDYLGSLHWRYRADGFWSHYPDSARPVMRAAVSGGTESAFSAWRDATGWHVAGRRGGVWGTPDLVLWTTTRLDDADPVWTERVLAQLPTGAYLPWVHPDVPLADGAVAATYNVAGQPASWLAVDVR